MNKYELGIKIDQIKKLAAKKEYTEAAAIAKDINWTKVKDWQALATAINVQEAVGDYEEARDMAILAYNRNLGGRKLVYKLTEFFIKVGDFDNANELYEEYSKSSQHDVSRFILYYDLRKAQNASDNELVGILEDYRDHEIDEKYMYELAKLYYKTGRKEECIKTCDNIVLWFQDGIYVEKAVQLKEKLGVVLTKTQKGILEDVRKRKEDIEATKEELFAKQKELANLKRDEVEDVFREEDEKEQKSTGKQPVPEVSLNVPEFAKEQEEGPLSIDLVQNDQNDDIKAFLMKALNKDEDADNTKDSSVVMSKIETPQVEKPEVSETLSKDGEKNFSSEINKANVSLKELIENAKQKLADNYEQINKDYHAMLDAMQTIAEGNLDQEIQGDFGIFNPFRDELAQIQTGMKKAVEEEVKSQRMKTELITNVSHDLKTPLTAITTYIELLKKEDITEEERRSYIDTLERKSLRLKVLIEDLFEVSKANSNNIVLNKMELDVVNLIKQVSIEHVDKMKERGLELKWNVPEEKVLLMLDNQKTYRIFENLFVNVVKYAMQGSRVYLEVRKKASLVEIILKNMSAEEIHISGDEITERFVRGDSSRNTEGSGLGLAIAKSFTEAQGGEFHVEVDGDLFKVVILF